MAKKNELATVDNFELATLSGDLAEAFAEEMDGLGTIPYDRIKMPSGGGLAFEVPGEDEDSAEVASELVGVILHHHPVNAYWADKFNGGNEAPDCASADGHVGVDRLTGECKDCKSCIHNQFAEDGSGKACKNTHRLYFLREGNPIPVLITLPPTSLKYLGEYIGKRLLIKGMRSNEVVTKISLKKEQSRDNITYSRAVFSFVGKLPEDKCKAVAEMAAGIKAQSGNVAVDDEDYNRPKSDGFVDVPQGEENLPFD